MTERIPLGEKESLHREFKSREALKKPETIAREVVALLNAEGGVVWVGLRDEGDRAVEIEPVPGAEQERRRLRDYLVDTIEPSPAGEEVAVDVVAAGAGDILRVEARPQADRRPYAHLKESGRWFLIRIGDRNRPMAREELIRLFSTTAQEAQTTRERAFSELLSERRKSQEAAEERLWLALKPIRDIQIDLQDPRLKDYLLDPALTGNRRSGWNFSTFQDWPVLKRGHLIAYEDDFRRVEIRRDGQLSFSVPLEALNWKGEPGEIWPLTLLEYPISAIRMAREIYEGLMKSDDELIADLALIGLQGWKLRKGSPRSGYFSLAPKAFLESEDFILEKPLVFSYDQIRREPDRCGYRLLERVYEAFGYGRDSMPSEFDQATGRLVFPE